MSTDLEPPRTTVLIVAEAESPFHPSTRYMEQKLRELGLPVRLVSAATLPAMLARLESELVESGQRGGVLVIGQEMLGPLSGIQSFLRRCALTDVFALAPSDVGGDPLSLVLPLLYLGPRALRVLATATVVSAGGLEETIVRTLETLRDEGLVAEFFFDYAGLPEPGEDGRYFLRDALPFGPGQLLPFVPWRVFDSSPLVLERWAVRSQDIARYVLADGYPESVFWDTLLEAAAPETWFYSTGQYRILSGRESEQQASLPTSIVVQVEDEANLAAMLDAASLVDSPEALNIFFGARDVNTGTISSSARAVLDSYSDRLPEPTVQVVPREAVATGLAPFLYLDALKVDEQSDSDGVVLFLNDQAASGNWGGLGQSAFSQLLDNLTAEGPYQRSVRSLFQSQTRLGLTFPPNPLGQEGPRIEALGVGGPGEALAEQLRLSAPVLAASLPGSLRPPSNMFYAHVSALRPLVKLLEGRKIADLLGVLGAPDVARLVATSAFGAGYFATVVQTPRSAESQELLGAYRLDAVSRYLYPYTRTAVEILRKRVNKKKWRH